MERLHGCRHSAPPRRAEVRAAEQETRGKGVARASRVDDLGRLRLVFGARDDDAARAALDHERLRVDLANEPSLLLVREDDLGGPAEKLPKLIDAGSLDRGGRGEVDTRPAPRARSGERGLPDRRAREAVAGDVEPFAAFEPRRVELVRLQPGAIPRSVNIVRFPSGVATETTVPVPPPRPGPASSTPRAASSSASMIPAASSARLPMNRARPPSAPSTRRRLPPGRPGPPACGRKCPCPRRSARQAGRRRRGAGRRGCRSSGARSLQSPRGERARETDPLLRNRRDRRQRGRACRGRPDARPSPSREAPDAGRPGRLRAGSLLCRDARARRPARPARKLPASGCPTC